jgi:hypothetical protein
MQVTIEISDRELAQLRWLHRLTVAMQEMGFTSSSLKDAIIQRILDAVDAEENSDD